MEFLLISLGCLILLLAVIWRPFFKQYQASKNDDIEDISLREQTNINLYHEHKKEIEQDYADGGIDQENYQYLLAELDGTLLQDIEKNSTELSELQTAKSTKVFTIFWPVTLSLFVLVFSFGLYSQQGTYEQLTQRAPADSQHQGVAVQQSQEQRQQQAMAYIKELTQHVKANPEDSEAWYNLGQALISVANFDGAIKAIDQVIKLEGEHADLIGAKAQASYYRNNQEINEEVQQLINKALSLDPADASTNILLGMHNFLAANYQQAIIHWQTIIDANKPGVNVDALTDAIGEAKIRMNSPAPVKTQESQSAGEGPQLKVQVSLSSDIADEVAKGNDKVVFIYAIPTNGQRMPLAAVKLTTGDLPTQVVLNNQQAMTPASNLSSAEQVHIYAVVSKQGGAGIKAGDFKGERLNIDVNSEETIELVINHVVE